MFPYSRGVIKRTGNSVRSIHEFYTIYTTQARLVFYVDIFHEMFCGQRNSYVFENKYRQGRFPGMKGKLGFTYNLG
jgi:hypothetical protein